MSGFIDQLEGEAIHKVVSFILPYVIGLILITVAITLLLVWLIWFNKRRGRCSSRRKSCRPKC